jgi:prenyltransferase beta subunit
VFDDSDLVGTERFLLTQCQSSLFGGFSKLPQPCMPDVLHSHYSLTWLSMAIEAHAPTEDGADADGDWIGGDLRGHEGGGAHLVPVKCYAPLRAVDAATGICRERLSSFLAGKK